MNILTGKEFAAAVFAPLAAGPGMFVGTLVSDPSIILHQEWWVTLIQPFYFILLTLPVSAISMLLLGIPAYLLLKAFKLNKPIIVFILGAPLAYLAFRVMGGGDGYNDDMWSIIFVTCGLAMSATAALIVRLQIKSNNQLQATQKPRA